MRDFLWREGDLSYKLWPQQEPIYQGLRALKGVTEVVVLCARQFGKSHLGVILAIEDCLRYPEKCVLIMGPTLKQTNEIVAPRIREIIKDAPPGLITRTKSESKWHVGSSELVIGGFDLSSSSQRGKSVQSIYVEEIVDSNPDDYTDSMRSDLGPALTHSKGGMMIFLTTPPKIPDHPFLTDTLSKAVLNNALYSYTIDDNKQLSEEQYDACVERAGGRDSVDFQREYLCRIVRDASVVVVPDFSPTRHVRPLDPGGIHHGQVSIDFGGVRDLTVALLHYYDFQLNKVCVWDERSFPANTATSTIIGEVLQMERNAPPTITITQRVCDAPGQLLTDLIQSHKFDCHLPPKDDWRAAINNLALGFTRNEIIVDPRCKLTVQTLSSGTFNAQRTDFARTLALGHCDAIAALMYGYRTQAKTNPYGVQQVSHHTGFTYRPPVKNDVLEFAESVVPKQFGKVRKFGKF